VRARRCYSGWTVAGAAALAASGFIFATGGARAQGTSPPDESRAPEPLPVELIEPEPDYATPTTFDRVVRVVAPIMVNGKGPFRFVLDTGANRSAIAERTLKLLALAPDAMSTVNVHGITGQAIMPSAVIGEMRAGELVFRNQRLPVLPDSVFANVDGILGIDCLQQARIEVDFERDRVTIRKSSGRRAAAGHMVVAAKLQHGGLLLVDGRVGKVPVKAILDTGAERSLGNEALREALAAGRRNAPASTIDSVIGATPQIVEGTSFVAPTIDLGGARLKNLTVTFGDLHVFGVWSLLDEPALLIGMDLLGTLGHFSVDYPRREFYLKLREDPFNRGRRCGGMDCRVWLSGG
jgi:predicted aspartyl protease